MVLPTRKKEDNLGWTIVITISIVITFSFTARFFYEQMHERSIHQAGGYTAFQFINATDLFGTIAEAATNSKTTVRIPRIDGSKLIQSAPELTILRGKKTSFEIGFKNTGSMPWRASGVERISLRSGAKRESYFYDPSWRSGTIIAPLSSDTQQGAVVYFRSTLEAPQKTGTFKEEFALYTGSKKIPKTYLSLPIKVSPFYEREASAASSVTLATSVAPLPPAPDLRAGPRQFLESIKLIQSAPALRIVAGNSVPFEVGYKNSGQRAWRVDDSPKVTLRTRSNGTSRFADPAWHTPSTPTSISFDVRQGEMVFLKFFLLAPFAPGNYTETFYLAFGDDPITGSEFALPIEVLSAPNSPSQIAVTDSVVLGKTTPEQIVPSTPADSHLPLPSSPVSDATILATTQEQAVPPTGIIDDRTAVEQLIRIGYFPTSDPVQIKSSSPYEIRDANNIVIQSVLPQGITTILFDSSSKLYTLQTPTGALTTTSYPRFTGVLQGNAPLDPSTIFEIVSYSNRSAWSSTINDNTVRGALEMRYSEKTGKVWVINELPLEQYLKGIAETSNNSPYEFQKALIVAARTYAQYHIDHNTKYIGEYFTIRATDFDQVYRGYGAESRLPSVTRAVEETRGVIVHYQGTLAITPYYSQSDGRTRSWGEVWGGSPKPWLVGKPDPAGQGLPLLGHGVGMPARGAISMALEGKTFEDILKYYYTGIELRRTY